MAMPADPTMRPRPRILVRTPDGDWTTARLANVAAVGGRRCAVVHASRWDRQGQPITGVQVVPEGNFVFMPGEDYSEFS